MCEFTNYTLILGKPIQPTAAYIFIQNDLSYELNRKKQLSTRSTSCSTGSPSLFTSSEERVRFVITTVYYYGDGTLICYMKDVINMVCC